MSKKITLSITAAVLLAAAGYLAAQEASGTADTRQSRSGSTRRRYSRPEPLSAEAEKNILDIIEDMNKNQRRCVEVTLKTR